MLVEYFNLKKYDPLVGGSCFFVLWGKIKV